MDVSRGNPKPLRWMPLRPFLSELRGSVVHDRFAVTKAGHGEVPFCQCAQATLALFEVFIPQRQTQPYQVGAGIRGEENPAMLWPQERQLARTVARNMNGGEAACHGQGLAIFNAMLDGCRLNRIDRPGEDSEHDAIEQPGSGCQRTEPRALGRDRGIQRMDVHLRSGGVLERGQASDMIGMRVGDDDVTDIVRLLPQVTERLQHRIRLAGVSRVDQRAAIRGVQQKRVHPTNGDDVKAVDDKFCGHASISITGGSLPISFCLQSWCYVRCAAGMHSPSALHRKNSVLSRAPSCGQPRGACDQGVLGKHLQASVRRAIYDVKCMSVRFYIT